MGGGGRGSGGEPEAPGFASQDEAGQNLRPPKARATLGLPRAHPRGHGSVARAPAGDRWPGGRALRPGCGGDLFYRLPHPPRARGRAPLDVLSSSCKPRSPPRTDQLQAPVILIWDTMNTDISAAMGRFGASSHPGLAHRGPVLCLRSGPQPRPGRPGLPQKWSRRPMASWMWTSRRDRQNPLDVSSTPARPQIRTDSSPRPD